MKPKNFPGRKLARIKGAEARFPSGSSRTGTRTEQQRQAERLDVEALARMGMSQARAIRTKKDRSHKAKIGRS